MFEYVKNRKLSTVLIFLYGLFSALISNILDYHIVKLSTVSDIFVFLVKAFCYSFFLFMMIALFEKLAKSKGYKSHFTFDMTRGSILKLSAVFIAVYMIYLIVFYPGVCNYDTINQINDLITGDAPLPFSWIGGQEEISCLMNDHHPIFDTLVFTFFYKIGEHLGSLNLGMFIYTTLQIVLTSFSFSFMLCSMSKWKGEVKAVQQTGFLFLLLCPFVPMFVICMVKDSLFGFLFVLYVTFYILILIEESKKKYLVYIIILSLLLALTKKTGIYQILITDLLLLFPKDIHRDIKKVALVVVSMIIPSLIIFVLFPKVIFPQFNIYPGGKQESMGFMLQQVSRVVCEHEDELSDEELAVIDKMITIEDIKEYYENKKIDTVKDHFNFYATDDEVKAFKKTWLKLGMRYPGSYVNATVEVSGYFFVPSKKIGTYQLVPSESIGIKNPDSFQKWREAFAEVFGFIDSFPGISFLFTLALYCFMIPAAAVIKCVQDRSFRKFLCIMPALVCCLVLIVCPVAYGRYALPHFYILPLMLGMFGVVTEKEFAGESEKDIEKESEKDAERTLAK